ncbi:MAG TPA: FtsQ-type POTRA domain-containing protein [Dermatophilaceae bacterium]|nr:FtsQ-type POTRA domain-containing protein [Dermatophilaceae bacterium]
MIRNRPRSRATYLGVAGALVVLAMLGWLLFLSPVLVARDVEVRGTSGGAREQVRRLAGPSLGKPLVKVDVAGLESQVRGLGGYAEVSVTRRWPRTIAIEVQPRQPVVTIRDGEGQLQVVDKQGRMFAIVNRAPTGAPLVTLTGLGDGSADGVQAALATAATAVGALSPAQRADVREVSVAGPNRVVLGFKGTRVVWGDGSNTALKARVMTHVMAQGTYRAIDVSAPENPATSD